MQQVHFKAPADPSPHEWYLDTFQAEIPELAPSDEEHAEWQKKMDELPRDAIHSSSIEHKHIEVAPEFRTVG